MKTVLIISYSPLHRDPRILRQIQALKIQYNIITIGHTPPFFDNAAIRHYPVKPGQKSTFPEKIERLFQFMRQEYLPYYKKTLDLEDILKNNIETPDVIIANDWNGLYLAVSLKNENKWQAKIYFDAHEYAPGEYDTLKWRLLIRPVVVNALKKCKKYINVMSTVCDGIAREYEKFFGFPSGFVTVITNAPAYQETLRPTALHKDKIRLIHHGGAQKKRKLELMIKMMRYLDPEKYELTFMLVPDPPGEYYTYLVNTASKFKNIHFIEPVETAKIAQTINEFDIGIYIFKEHGFNSVHALPNKFFEYIQARLAIAIGSSVEMTNLVSRYNLGINSNNFSPKSLAKSIMVLSSDEIMNYKNNADKYARELSAENNLIKIRKIVDDFVGE
jgi:glycosyltransferase involved in cell wall biosynthesis